MDTGSDPKHGDRSIDETAPDEAPVAVRRPAVAGAGEDRAEGGETEPSRAALDETAPDPPEVQDTLPAVDETAPDLPEVTDDEPAEKRSSPKRAILRGLLVLLGLLCVAGAILVLVAPGYIRSRIEEAALARGMVVTYRDVDVGFSRVVLDGVEVSLVGVPDFSASAARVEVDVVDWQPQAVRAHELDARLFGTGVVEQLSTWKSANPRAFDASIDADKTTLTWQPTRSGEPVLSFRDAAFSVDDDAGSIKAADVLFAGGAAGPVDILWVTEDDDLEIEIQPKKEPLSALTIDITASGKSRPQLKLTLERTKLSRLQEALGIPKGSEGLEAEGEAELPLPSLEQPSNVDGSVRLAVTGYVPPHPKELDGIVFGKVTKVQAHFTLMASFEKAKISQIQVENGALSLSGLGQVERAGFDALVSLTLKGTIPCTALASSAATAHLGREWGKLLGDVAGGVLRGNVSVLVSVDAKASDVKSAKITHSARLGCKAGLPGLPQISFE